MDRKTLVEQAFQKLALGTEEQRFVAIRDFKKALEFQDSQDIYPDNKIQLYIILTEINNDIGTAKTNLKQFLKDWFFNGQNIHWEGDKMYMRTKEEDVHIGNVPNEYVEKVYLNKNVILSRNGGMLFMYFQKEGGNKYIGNFSLKDIDFFVNELPQIWLKSLKYDAFMEQFGQAKEQLQLKKQELGLLEQFFDTIEPKDKEPKLLE